MLAGDPVELGYVFWAAIHGLIVLDLAGRIPADPASRCCAGAPWAR